MILRTMMSDDLVKDQEFTTNVMPAKAGIQTSSRRIWIGVRDRHREPIKRWTPAFAGVTTFYGFMMNECTQMGRGY